MTGLEIRLKGQSAAEKIEVLGETPDALIQALRARGKTIHLHDDTRSAAPGVDGIVVTLLGIDFTGAIQYIEPPPPSPEDELKSFYTHLPPPVAQQKVIIDPSGGRYSAVQFKANYQLLSCFYREGKYLDVPLMTDDELKALIDGLPERVKRNQFYARDGQEQLQPFRVTIDAAKGETYARKKMQFAEVTSDMFDTLGLDTTSPDTRLLARSRDYLSALQRYEDKKRLYARLGETLNKQKEMEAAPPPPPSDTVANLHIVALTPESFSRLATSEAPMYSGSRYLLAQNGPDKARYTLFIPGDKRAQVIEHVEELPSPKVEGDALTQAAQAPSAAAVGQYASRDDLMRALANSKDNPNTSLDLVMQHRDVFDQNRDGRLDNDMMQALAGHPNLILQINASLQLQQADNGGGGVSPRVTQASIHQR